MSVSAALHAGGGTSPVICFAPLGGACESAKLGDHRRGSAGDATLSSYTELLGLKQGRRHTPANLDDLPIPSQAIEDILNRAMRATLH